MRAADHLAQRGGQRGERGGCGQAGRGALRTDGTLGAAGHALQRRCKVRGAPVRLGAGMRLHGMSIRQIHFCDTAPPLCT